MRLALAAIAAVLPLGALAAAPAADVHTVLAKPVERIQTADYRALGHLVRVDASGARTSYPITLKAHWFPGVLRVFAAIDAPGNARVHVLLEMRSNGQDSIHIAHPGDKASSVLPFEKWTDGPLGSGFSYEDFLEAQYFWPSQTVHPGIKYGARECDLVDSTPGAEDRTHYTEMKTWLDHTIGYPVYVEKTLKGTRTIKEFTSFGLRQTSGVWSASQVEAKIHGQGGSTLLIIDRGSVKANLSLKDFGPEQMTHF